MWQPVVATDNEAPSVRCKHACCVLDSHIYLLAGRNGNVPLRDFWKLDLASDTWHRITAGGDTPPCLQEHSMVTWKQQLYVFGGEMGFSSGTDTPLWCYDIKSNFWRKLSRPASSNVLLKNKTTSGGSRWKRITGSSMAKQAEQPRALRGHSAVVYNNCMYLYGGYRDLKGSTGQLWQFEFESETWTEVVTGPGPPEGRHGHSAVLQDGCMWIYGGMTDLNERSDLWRLDLESRQWSQWRCRGQLPAPRHSHVAAAVLSWMVVYGGQSRGQYSQEVWRFHFSTESWERVTVCEPQPQARCQCAVAVISWLIPPVLHHHHQQQQKPKRIQTVAPSIPQSTEPSVPVVHADVLRQRCAANSGSTVAAASFSRTSGNTGFGTAAQWQPPPPALGCNGGGSGAAALRLPGSHFLSRFVQANLSLRQPSYSALSNGSAESVEMQCMQQQQQRQQSSGEIPRSHSTYAVSPVMGSVGNAGCSLPSDRVSFPDLLGSTIPNAPPSGANIQRSRVAFASGQAPRTLTNPYGCVGMTTVEVDGNAGVGDIGWQGRVGCEYEALSDYSSIEHCERTGFDNPNYTATSGSGSITAVESGAPTTSLPLCCSHDSGISDRHMISPADTPIDGGKLVGVDQCDPALRAFCPLFFYVIGGRETLPVTRFKRPVSVWRLQIT